MPRGSDALELEVKITQAGFGTLPAFRNTQHFVQSLALGENLMLAQQLADLTGRNA